MASGSPASSRTSSSGAQIYGFFEDTVIFNAPGKTGQTGTVDFSLGICGNSLVCGSVSSAAQYLLDARLGNTSTSAFGGIQSSSSGTEVFGQPVDTVSISGNVVFGSTALLHISFGSAAGASS